MTTLDVDVDPLIERAKRFGTDSPMLIIDTAILRRTAEVFASYSPTLSTYYAIKANADPGVLRVMDEVGVGFEIASEGELHMVLRQGISPERIITSNPIKPVSFVETCYKLGITRFVADCTEEVDKLAVHAPGCEIMMRLAVDNTGASWPLSEKFAASPYETIQVATHAKRLGINPVGIVFHVGSQSTNPDSWTTALRDTANVWNELKNQGIYLNILNVGGGFPATHDGLVPDHKRSLDSIVEATAAFTEARTIQVEPGRGMVGDAGVLVSRVIGKANRTNAHWLYLDAGVFHGLMESVGGINYRYACLDTEGPNVPWTLAGPSCDSMDVIAKNIQLPEDVEVGDRIAIAPAGAYTTVYACDFNGLSQPSVLCI
jgi:ornithine decarboxylase